MKRLLRTQMKLQSAELMEDGVTICYLSYYRLCDGSICKLFIRNVANYPSGTDHILYG